MTTYRTTDDPRDLYHNVVVALDAACDLNSGQPSALAVWIQTLELKPGDRVYHWGCGVGYYTAIIAEVVGPGGSVVGSEVHPELAARAQVNVSAYANVTVHSGDGAEFDPAPCDATLINAGVTHPHPLWLEWLREGGRLVLPLTMTIPHAPAMGMGAMVKIVRSGGTYRAGIVSPVAIFSCSSVRDPQLGPLLAKAVSSGSLFKLESVRTDPHELSETCILHRSDVRVSSAETAAAAT